MFTQQSERPVANVVIQLDACRADYISRGRTPFLQKLADKGLSGSLVPTFGFEPEAAYLAGLYPDECDGGMHFWYEPEQSHFKTARILPACVDGAPWIMQLVLRRLISWYVGKRTVYSRVRFASQTCRIPFRYLPCFDIADKHLFDDPKFARGQGIFSLLKANNKRYFLHGAPACPTRAEKVLQAVERADHPYDFIFLHIGDLDGIGHKYGPHSMETRQALKRVDDVLRRIYDFLKGVYGDLNLVVFGDHGMVEVEKCLNIKDKLKSLRVTCEKDYIYFLDSTFARFWVFTERAEQEIKKMLGDLQGGHTLSQAEMDQYHLNYSHNRFGDLIFFADPGVLILPNFWNNTLPEKGMHGYAPEYPGQQSALVIHSSKVKAANRAEDPVDMRRIFPTFLDLMDLGIPERTSVKSLL